MRQGRSRFDGAGEFLVLVEFAGVVTRKGDFPLPFTSFICHWNDYW